MHWFADKTWLSFRHMMKTRSYIRKGRNTLSNSDNSRSNRWQSLAIIGSHRQSLPIFANQKIYFSFDPLNQWLPYFLVMTTRYIFKNHWNSSSDSKPGNSNHRQSLQSVFPPCMLICRCSGSVRFPIFIDFRFHCMNWLLWFLSECFTIEFMLIVHNKPKKNMEIFVHASWINILENIFVTSTS